MAHRTDIDRLASPVGAGEALEGARALRIDIRGVVQGVGFRPFVYRVAHECGLVGWVRNTSAGVEIEVEGSNADLQTFARRLATEAPPIARIESFVVQELDARARRYERFEILHSQARAGDYQLVSTDVATCADCLREINDPHDRRFRYPFTNCTNCGPRFTIIADIPYDRPRTTMRAFTMCPACQREYDDPLDRRFHAQPNACPVCGPHVTLRDAHGRPLAERDEALRRTAELLREGQIVAIKGLGGYQLACDATQAEPVARLRARKGRPHKPFAVMVRDLGVVEEHAEIDDAERELLSSTGAPIVLLAWRPDSAIASGVAPNSRTIGLMLPYTPLHHILLRDVGRPLVMTSGNLTEEPIAQDNDEALRRLGEGSGADGDPIADYFLTHDRGIHSRYDDSVFLVHEGEPQPVRRARGYAPSPIRLPWSTRPILACGPELKNTFCLTRDRYAFVSQHIGDMQNLETLTHFEETIALYKQLFRVEPEVIAHDLHPDYLSTRYALAQPGAKVAVQHHHAHLAACLADRGHTEPAIGVILDGTGYGLDGRIWGGEFLVGDASGFARAARLPYLPLPGGEGAMRKPYRIALAYMQSLAASEPLPEALASIPPHERAVIARMVEGGLNSPLTSSAGRLFDAVSALIGVSQETSYEAQAAIELEQRALAGSDSLTNAHAPEPYPYGLTEEPGLLTWQWKGALTSTLVFDLGPLWQGLLADLRVGVSTGEIAWRFHLSLAQLIAETCEHLRQRTALDTVALSGGCFQNRLLLRLTVPRLRERGFEVLTHRQVPCNDGGIALGQAAVAHLAGGDAAHT